MTWREDEEEEELPWNCFIWPIPNPVVNLSPLLMAYSEGNGSKKHDGIMIDVRMGHVELSEVIQELDVNGSGSIDSDELEAGMKHFGLHPEWGEAARLIVQYELDDTGTIGMDEFIDLMTAITDSNETHYEVVDMATGYAVEIPHEGVLSIEFLDIHVPSETDAANAKEGVSRLISHLKDCQNQVQMIEMVQSGMCLKGNEAQLIVDSLVEVTDIVKSLSTILPFVLDSRNAIQLILASRERMRLQNVLRQAYSPILGMASGHYKLDLADEMESYCRQETSGNEQQSHG